MSSTDIWTLGILVVVWLPLGVLTAIGAKRRGRRWRTAWLAGPIFPLTWTIWYFTDERAAGGRATRLARRQGL